MKRTYRSEHILLVSLGLLGLGVLAGCGTPTIAHKTPKLEAWSPPPARAEAVARAAPASAEATPQPAPEPRVAEPPPETAAAPLAQERKLPTTLVTDLDMSERTDVATVLRALAKSADVNLLISPHVTGQVSFTFRQVPWDEAFRSVIASAGLTYVWDGEILRVLTVEDLRKELEIETIRKERESVKVEMRKTEPLQVQVIKVRYTKATSLGATLQALMTQTLPEGSTDTSVPKTAVTVDEENNAIVVHAKPSDIEKALALVAKLDRPKPQVLIEARIVEAGQDTARQLGIQWGGHYTTVNGNRIQTVGGPGMTTGGYVSDFPSPFTQELSRPYGFTLGFISERMGGGDLLNMQLTALQRDGRIKILSSPSVTTLDNEKAMIESGEERAYRKTTGTGNILDVTLEWKKAVLKLEVTPHVIDGQRLRVEIVANKDSFDETKPQTNGEFPVNTKRASTTVLLFDGQTTVIGGLARETKSNSETGVPILKDIPLLGYLFRNHTRSSQKDDTLIFITPRIIQDEE